MHDTRSSQFYRYGTSDLDGAVGCPAEKVKRNVAALRLSRGWSATRSCGIVLDVVGFEPSELEDGHSRMKEGI
jgi:hypothetical protein